MLNDASVCFTAVSFPIPKKLSMKPVLFSPAFQQTFDRPSPDRIPFCISFPQYGHCTCFSLPIPGCQSSFIFARNTGNTRHDPQYHMQEHVSRFQAWPVHAGMLPLKESSFSRPNRSDSFPNRMLSMTCRHSS